jgi:hypothetical protein
MFSWHTPNAFERVRTKPMATPYGMYFHAHDRGHTNLVSIEENICDRRISRMEHWLSEPIVFVGYQIIPVTEYTMNLARLDMCLRFMHTLHSDLKKLGKIGRMSGTT